jgi:4-hydroxybenzoate polyprenyltransferase
MIAYLKIIRPHQWLKNLMLLFPPFLGGMIMKPGIVREGIVPFIAFCLASSATYILNDLLDSPRDRNHPLKKTRPVAAGQISIKAAGILSFTMTVAAIFAGFRVSTYFALFIVAYLAIFAAYSFKLKELPIIDIFCVAAGFILRLQAGGVAFNVVISDGSSCVFFSSQYSSALGKGFARRVSWGPRQVSIARLLSTTRMDFWIWPWP